MANFEKNVNSADIVLVGCGGTGSAIARHIARMVYDMKQRRITTPRFIRFVDPDVIEPSNIGRQMFSEGEVGQYKAQVLAGRFNRVFGLNIEYFNEPFSKEHLSSSWRSTIIIGAVDNHIARQSIASCANDKIWIDAGNKRSAGQVIVGTTDDQHTLEREVSKLRQGDDSINHLPTAGYIFPDLLKPEPPEELQDASCAELMALGEQDILINDMMANISAQYLKKLLYRQPIQTFCTFVDSDLLSMRSLLVDAETLQFYITENESEIA